MNMKKPTWFGVVVIIVVALFGTLTFTTSSFAAPRAAQCDGSPSQAQLRTALHTAVGTLSNGGFGLNMWATVATRDGVVCATAFYGQADDPVAEAYRRALVDAGPSASNGQPDDLVATVFCRALEAAGVDAKTRRSNDPVAEAYRMALKDSCPSTYQP
jgi:hypothetical protein